MEKRDNGLAHVLSTQALVDWWRETASTQLAHDFAIIGRTDGARSDLDAIEVLMQYGVLEGDRSNLLSHCVSLIRAWRIMHQVSVFDLGPCGCVGTKKHHVNHIPSRSFLIHGLEDSTGRLTFLILSAEGWADETKAKDFVTHLIQPLSTRTKHLQGIKAHLFSNTTNIEASLTGQPTPREQEIAQLLSTGHSNKEIARILDISPNTVRNHISRLADKLGARNRTQVAMLFSNYGVTPPSSAKQLP